MTIVPRAVAAAVILSGALAGCATTRPSAPPAAPVPVVRLDPALHWVRNSAEYRALARQAYAMATRRVEAAAAGRAPRTWGVILDADETVLDNSAYEKERALAGRKHEEDRWNEWVRRRQADVVPGARGFLERVRALGGVIAIVTNRADLVCEDTRANFTARSLPFDVMLCKQGELSDKNPRFQAVAQGTAAPGLPAVEVLAVVGDNIRDFPGQDQDLRQKPDEAFAPFGTNYFVIPNPLYGSWENNSEN